MLFLDKPPIDEVLEPPGPTANKADAVELQSGPAISQIEEFQKPALGLVRLEGLVANQTLDVVPQDRRLPNGIDPCFGDRIALNSGTIADSEDAGMPRALEGSVG